MSVGIGGGVLYGLVADGIQYGAGQIYRNAAYQDMKTIADFETWRKSEEGKKCHLGATNGGINNNFNISYGTVAIDGYELITFKGGLLPESSECYVSTTLKNITPKTLQAAVGTSRFAASEETTDNTISMRVATNLADDDYNDNITVFATTTWGVICISYHNCVCKVDGSIATQSGIAGGTLGFRADATAASIEDDMYLPVEVKFLFKSQQAKMDWLATIDDHRIFAGE